MNQEIFKIMETPTKPQSSFLKKCVLVGIGAIAVLANVSHQYPTQAPVVNTTPFDNAEFGKIMANHAENRDRQVFMYTVVNSPADAATNYQMYSRVCTESDHGTQKVKALPFLRSAIALQFNLPESDSFVEDFASVVNATTLDLGCDRTAPLSQGEDLSSRD